MAGYQVLFLLLSALSLAARCKKLDCPPLPPLSRPARTVHELKPQDIKVVMALGDSVTAGIRSLGPLEDRRLLFFFFVSRVWLNGFPWSRFEG